MKFFSSKLFYSITLAAAASVMAIPALAAPTISFPKSTHDFGKIGQGMTLPIAYNFKNTGNEPLTISGIQASCGCTNATTTVRTVQPGKSAQIKVDFHSGSFRGKVTKTLTVMSNDPKNPAVTLSFSGVVQPAVEISPVKVNFNNLKKGKKFSQTVIVKPADPKGFKVNSTQVRSKFINVSKPTPSKSIPGAVELRITIDGTDAPVGRVLDVIQVHSNAKGNPTGYIQVVGNIVD